MTEREERPWVPADDLLDTYLGAMKSEGMIGAKQVETISRLVDQIAREAAAAVIETFADHVGRIVVTADMADTVVSALRRKWGGP